MSDQLDDAARIQEHINAAKAAVAKLHEAHKYDLRCCFCNELVFFVAAPVSMEKGHIYSEAGSREFKMTRICEFCFDETCEKFAGSEEENEYDSRGNDELIELIKLRPGVTVETDEHGSTFTFTPVADEDGLEVEPVDFGDGTEPETL